VFSRLRRIGAYSLLQAELLTGRTHQIRVHAAHIGHPIAGDEKYGDLAANKASARQGLKRMFLHAGRIAFRHPATGTPLALEAPLPPELTAFLDTLERTAAGA
jgi:23S rRNA pseudouridine955/2504/2580 synthase